ncbi:MAG TPA: metalloregulator ArsR/SmtB family transcription factor [Puia sp.]|jgi:DNA-binding transcriptional ArsR family regulator|nr:metalloregulator ArsR/SmtB family transcription factor [Puia sp.]
MSAQPARKHDIALNALGDPTRRAIFEKLGRGALSVAHIADGMSVTRPAVSQHLKVLREAKLISMHQIGTRSYYRIDPEGLTAIRDYLDRFWDEALGNFKQLAEATEKASAANSKKLKRKK